MRKDVVIAILLGIAAMPYGAAMMAAPDYFHFSPFWAFWFFWGGIVSSAAIVALALIVALKGETDAPAIGHKRRMIALVGMLVFGAGFIACAAWYFWPNAAANQTIAARQSPHKAERSPFDQAIQFECAWSQLPSVIPPFGFFAIQLTGGGGDGAVMSSAARPGSKVEWPSPDLAQTYACKFTNYGVAPALNLQADIPVVYRATIKEGDNVKSGDVVKTVSIRTPVCNIGVGAQNVFEFYITNRSQYFAELTVPTTVWLQAVGGDNLQSVRLVSSPSRVFAFVPNRLA